MYVEIFSITTNERSCFTEKDTKLGNTHTVINFNVGIKTSVIVEDLK